MHRVTMQVLGLLTVLIEYNHDYCSIEYTTFHGRARAATCS